MHINGLDKRIAGSTGKAIRLAAGATFEMALLGLLLLTAGAVVWQKPILERTLRFAPDNIASKSHGLFSDHDVGGKTVIRGTGPLKWTCDLRAGNPYPYCGYELYLDRHEGTHGIDLSNMRSFAITLLYSGPATSYRVQLKNFDAHYADRADDETPKYMRVETDTTPGKPQRAEFVLSDFGVADWWLRKRKLQPEFGRPQFNDITSLIVETGSEAPLGPHSFEVRDITIDRAILSDAQYYSLLLGIWIVMIVLYLGYRVGNLRRALKERQLLDALALREAQEAAGRDPLTGLLNRRGLSERFTALVRERGKTVSMTVILIDIDHFKALNDAHGHAQGDRALEAFAAVIGRNVRAVDIAARWGGEEFVVVCTKQDRKGAMRLAEKLRACVEGFDFGASGPLTASFGVHWLPAIDADLAAHVAIADKALYAAKAAGRNCCRMLEPAVSRAA